MTSHHPLRGIATITFWAADHAAAKQWYTQVLGMEPYFDRPGYFEFRLGDRQTELGVIDAAYAPMTADQPGGAIAYWHVDDLDASVRHFIESGATEFEPVTPRSDGFVTASVLDPFGNIIGLMYNPHYLDSGQH